MDATTFVAKIRSTVEKIKRWDFFCKFKQLREPKNLTKNLWYSNYTGKK